MKQKIDAIIPCAGNSKRMKVNLPKSLLKVNGESSLNHQLKILDKYINIFYIIINQNLNEKEKYIKRIDKKFIKRIRFVQSKAGSGDGMAILNGLDYINKHNINPNSNNIFICWGDIYFKNNKILNKLRVYFSGKINIKTILIPLRFKNNPYVSFIFDKKNNLKNVLFQRRNQFVDKGYQDLGVFIINNNFIHKLLIKMKNTSNENNELNFLDSIKQMYNNKKYAEALILNFDPETFSFNKINELNITRYHAKKL